MIVKKFIAKSTVEALRMVKKDLGADAIILSTKKIDGGIEILASTHQDLESISTDKIEEVVENKPKPKTKQKNDAPTFSIDDFCDSIINDSNENSEKNTEIAKIIEVEQEDKEDFIDLEEDSTEINNLENEFAEESQTKNEVIEEPKKITRESIEKLLLEKLNNKTEVKKVSANHVGIFKPLNHSEKQEDDDILDILEGSQANTLLQMKDEIKNQEKINYNEKVPEKILNELKSLRNIVEKKLNINEISEIKINILNYLLSIGFSAKLSKDLISNINNPVDLNDAENSVKDELSKILKIVKSKQDIINKPGVYVLLGPTGVGKTTTTAKIAAKSVLNYGSESVSLITTDTYRIGAYEQLKIYGKLLKVPVTLVKDLTSLTKTINKLKETKKIIIVDTVGMSQKDKNIETVLGMFQDVAIQKVLLLSANSNSQTLDDIIKSYSKYGLSSCIITKEDEAVGLGAVIDAIVRNNLTIQYICNGQRVPEDIILPSKVKLISKIFNKENLINSKQLTKLDIALLLYENI